MKYIRILLFALFFAPIAAFAQTNEFMVAAQLLSAAKNADIQQVQILINSGADVNYIDKTGLSLVCTALMNNDVRAAQILQMYGADASQCDKQIKQYRSRATKTRGAADGGGGLFSGLSSAQSLTLTAAGAAVVIGGLFLLTDVLDSDNSNDNGAGGAGNRPNNNGGDNGGGTNRTPLFTLPYGPATLNATGEANNYTNNLNALVTDAGDGTINKNTFALMNVLGANSQGQGGQNYLLMMHGYSPMARGYMGMRTLRTMDNSPVPPSAWADYKVNGQGINGGRPTGVGLITTNGVNAAPKPKGATSAEQSSLDDVLLAWTGMNGNFPEQPAPTNLSSKYYNNIINDITEGTNTYTSEDASLIDVMDLSGFGTAVNNTLASNMDNLLAKIVGGRISGAATADSLGFMPNGQMAIFRTGGGKGMVKMPTPVDAGSYTTEDGILKTITLPDGTVLNVTQTGTKITAENTDGTVKYSGYIGADGLLYAANGDNPINAAYELKDNKLTQVKEAGQIDFTNYQAMKTAIGITSDSSGGRSKLDIVANASVLDSLHDISAKRISDVLSAGTVGSTEQKARLLTFVNQYYDRPSTESNPQTQNDTQMQAAGAVFSQVGNYTYPLLIFSAGAYDKSQTDSTWDATFENAAPLAYNNLEHLFMSVVAVSLSGNGTSGAKDVSGFSTSGNKFVLSDWSIGDKRYGARKCGIAGTGAGGIDPWCFASAGLTDEMAVASAAGAAGVIKSAFDNIKSTGNQNTRFDNKMLFTLMALTADGAYLGTNPATGYSWANASDLEGYLSGMYTLPTEIQVEVDAGQKSYLDAFKEVFGYGLINLERATQPGKGIYFYNGTDIVSTPYNAYWRAASAGTMFRASAAFAPRAATISAPFFDLLESFDGELSMPRVWQNEFTIGSGDKRGLYMGDVLGEFKTRRDAPMRTQIGNIGFSMATSQRAYDDNLGGLDAMRFDYDIGNWDLAAGYQRHMTDGASRFAGVSNPIFGLASNAITSDAHYNMGRWSFGARAFSGSITDETLLENDPTLSARYEPAHLGRISGAAGDAAFSGDKFTFNASIGTARESDTILGAQTGGLLNLGAGDTTYVDAEMRYKLRDDVSFMMRSTFARTTADAAGEFILGMSDIESDAFAIGADIGNFSFTVSRPLGVNRGKLQYAHAEYDIVENDGKYELAVRDTHVADIDLSPAHRELRFSGEYRHNFGEFTDGAIGFIYRVNPNHTSDFGNESIFMLKMTHRLGI